MKRSHASFLLLLGIAAALGVVLVFVLEGVSGKDRAARSVEEEFVVTEIPGHSPGNPLDPTDRDGNASRTPGVAPSPKQPKHLLRGRVLTESGDAIAGASLHALPPRTYALDDDGIAQVCEPTRSNDRGEFTLGLHRTEPVVVVCRKSEFIPATRLLDHPDIEHLDIVLQSGASITGRVVDESGAPLVGARIHARAASVTHGVATGEGDLWPGVDAVRFASAASDPLGRFEIPGLDPAIGYIIEATAPGYATIHSSRRTPELNRKPPADVGDIVFLRVFAAVFGIRRGEVDHTGGMWSSLFGGGAEIDYPTGYELAYAGIPRDRFPAPITRRLETLARGGGVILVRTTAAGSEGITRDPSLTIRFRVGGGEVARFEVRLVPIGAPAWDERQWFELPPDGAPAPGTVVIRPAEGNGDDPASPGFRLRSRDDRALGGVFLTRWDEEREAHVAVVPPGRYDVRRAIKHRESLPGSIGIWAIEVASHQVAELAVPREPGIVLKIDPRLPSGTPARELAIYIRRSRPGGGHDYLVNIQEPYGCVDGPERIHIPPDLTGRVELVVRKAGYEVAIGAAELGEGDRAWRPSLRPFRMR